MLRKIDVLRAAAIMRESEQVTLTLTLHPRTLIFSEQGGYVDNTQTVASRSDALNNLIAGQSQRHESHEQAHLLF